ncbi:hypothetical protein BB559_002096 [Furculomyces boomerangus]|uniref:Uncharacterized protein n=2 Tax=Harpellales TaxID=61421 RepID=A0A2T9YYA6_9FUNG|nr:hypothetical protein BB559_002096 [Furculomyces boomerangus]PWA02331.1 hypothetical protein BB558_001539 [Smittium angustum]
MSNNQTKEVPPFTTFTPDEKDRLAIQRRIIESSCGMMFRVFIFLSLFYLLKYGSPLVNTGHKDESISSQKTSFDEFTDRNIIVFLFVIMPLFFEACTPIFFLYKIWKVEIKSLETLDHYNITSDVVYYGLNTWLFFFAGIIKKAYPGILSWIGLAVMVFITYKKVCELHKVGKK